MAVWASTVHALLNVWNFHNKKLGGNALHKSPDIFSLGWGSDGAELPGVLRHERPDSSRGRTLSSHFPGPSRLPHPLSWLAPKRPAATRSTEKCVFLIYSIISKETATPTRRKGNGLGWRRDAGVSTSDVSLQQKCLRHTVFCLTRLCLCFLLCRGLWVLRST